MLNELELKTTAALIRIPQVQMGMDAMENFFRRFFPQFGDLEKLAKQMKESAEQTGEVIESAKAEVAKATEAAAGISSGGFSAPKQQATKPKTPPPLLPSRGGTQTTTTTTSSHRSNGSLP